MNRFSPNLLFALILWRSGLGLLIGNFSQLLTELSAHHDRKKNHKKVNEENGVSLRKQ